MAQHTDHETDAAGAADEHDESTATTDETTDELRADDSDPVASLEAEVEALREQCKRAQADYQNLRRRSQTDYEAGLKRALQPLLEELLFVVDYLELALASPTTTDEAKNLATGVEMTRMKLLQALESAEVYTIATDGPFDPRLHDAAESRADENAEPGSILETTRKGYTWRELVLRPAQVVVAAADDEGADSE